MVRGRYGYQPEMPASPGIEGVGILEGPGSGRARPDGWNTGGGAESASLGVLNPFVRHSWNRLQLGPNHRGVMIYGLNRECRPG